MNRRPNRTTDRVVKRDYSLTGPEAKAALAAGFDNADWYQAPIDPERLKVLMARRNGRPAADAALWAVLVIGSGTVAFLSLGTWWAIPAFAAFGTLWGGSADSRWHENGHGTVFRTSWANDAMYNVAAFMMLREPTLWRWQHVRHHSNTQVVGLDPEVTIKRPTSLVYIALNYFNLVNGPKMLWKIVVHAAGHCEEYTRIIVPAQKLRRVVWEARIFLLLVVGALVAAVALGTIWPLLFVGLPSFYGAWFMWFCAVTQHAGLREDVLDHRMSTRTVYMNPVFRFLYLNMNYHVEHHMFPSVPYYNLPALHEEIKAFLPPPKTSLLAAYREVFHAVRMQQKDTAWEIDRHWAPPQGPSTTNGERAARSITIAAGPGEVGPGEVELGGTGTLAPGRLVPVEVNGAHYVLCRMLDGTYAFFEGLCTHGRARLSGGYLDDCIIECPKHNGRFDVRTGQAVRPPAVKPLCTYAVRVEGGRLFVALPAAGTAAGTAAETASAPVLSPAAEALKPAPLGPRQTR
jgi:fatty acid desaturase/nitrite reductase/ring-hydroxylating ferredoxin subunit